MERLKVLFITAWYPRGEQPGKGVFVREHAKAAALYDDVVVLHCPEPEASLPALTSFEQENEPSLTEGIPTYRACYRVSPVPKTSYAVYVWNVWRAYRRIVAAGFQPDILHAHVYEAGVPAALLGRRYGLPVVISEHFSAFPRATLTHGEVRKARFAFRSARVVMPVSRALQAGIERYGIRANFRIVPNVVDTTLFSPPQAAQEGTQDDRFDPRTQRRLLFVGSLIPLKGLPVLFKALATLLQVDWRLDIVGDGPERASYEAMAANLGMSTRVTFHGFQPKAFIADRMRCSDLFVLPSQWENLPCVVIEATASGLPIVASKVGGIPEIVQDDGGILVPPDDVPALTAALAKLLEDASGGILDRSRLAQRAQVYSPAVVGRTLADTYRQVLHQ